MLLLVAGLAASLASAGPSVAAAPASVVPMASDRPVAHDDPELTDVIDRFVARSWTTRDGLPQDTVTDLAQDATGYLWITTFGGVARFDGARFDVFDIARDVGLTTNRFVSVTVDRSGHVWLGTQDRGVYRYREGRFEVPRALRPLSATSVWDIHETADGALWFAAEDGLYRLVGSDLRRFTTADGLPSTTALALATDTLGRLWVGTYLGLARFIPSPSPLGEGVPPSPSPLGGSFEIVDPKLQIRSLLPIGDEMWVGLDHAIGRATDTGIETVLDDPLWHNAVAHDADGRIWVSSAQGPAILEGSRPRPVPLPDGGRPVFVRTLYPDRQGNVWVGTNGQGLFEVRPGSVLRHPLPATASSPDVGPILQDREGTIWVGGNCGGLGRVVGRGVEIVTPEVCVGGLAEDPTDGIWYTWNRFVAHRGRSGETVYGPESGLPPIELQVLSFDRDGALWVGARAAGVHRRAAGSARFAPVPGLEDVSADVIAQAPDGALWFGTPTGIVQWRPSQPVTRLGPEDGVPHGDVRFIHFDERGVAWVGTYGGGLARIEGEKVTRYTRADGLPDNALSWLLDDGAGNYWFNANHGAFRIRRADLEAFATNPRTALHAQSFPTGEGNLGQPGGVRATDGRLWFPTVAGPVSVLPPSDAPPRLTPRVLIEAAEIGGRPLAPGAEIRGDDRDLSVRFTAPWFADAEEIQFRYRLARDAPKEPGVLGGGVGAAAANPPWITAGEARTATWTNLRPGRYRFEVTASDRADTWTVGPATLAFAVVPRFTETGWFLLLLALGGFGAAALLSQLRIVRVGAHNAALRAEISAREEVERALRQREEHYRTLFEQAANGFVLHGSDGTLVDINATACAMLGRSREALIAQPPLAHVAPASRELYASIVQRACAGETVSAAGVLLVRGETTFEARMSAVPHRNDDGVARGRPGAAGTALVSLVDISDERRIEQERQALEAQLVVAQKLEAVGQLAGGVAHDFNNLLTVILGAATMLERNTTGDARERARDIQACGRRGATLTRKLLAFSRGQVLRPEFVELGPFLMELERLLRPALPADIGLTVEGGERVTVRVDPGQLEQAVINLAFNARDAMPEGGQVTLSIGSREVTEPRAGVAPGRYAMVIVADSGTGMDPAVRARIFEPFFTTKPPGKGTGLGLASVHGFVRQSGGFVEVESAPGMGTTFRVFLPAVEAPAARPPARPTSDPPRDGPRVILVCDDEPAVLMSVGLLLNTLGYEALLASSPEEALRLAGDAQFDLLLTDVVMPGMKGTELAARVRALRPDTRVVFMSGHQREPSLVGETFLEKPFSREALEERLGEVLG